MGLLGLRDFSHAGFGDVRMMLRGWKEDSFIDQTLCQLGRPSKVCLQTFQTYLASAGCDQLSCGVEAVVGLNAQL